MQRMWKGSALVKDSIGPLVVAPIWWLYEEIVTANDLSKVSMVNNPSEPETKKLSAVDGEWHESVKKKKDS